MFDFVIYIFLPLFIGAIVVFLVHPRLVKIALIKKIVDNPNARRLNKEPVPVMGGIGVFLGISMAVALCCGIAGVTIPQVVFAAALLMLYVGAIDDIFPLAAINKLLLQLFAVALLVFVGGMKLDDFNGLWGVYELPLWISYPLTFVALVGIINGFNLIDGVDGLSSVYSMVVAAICGVVFLIAGDMHLVILCFAIVGALIPFFIHNVFGRKYKMFMGDAGSLMLGVLFAVMISKIVSNGEGQYIKGVVSFVIATFSLPIFDTLRVMLVRMSKGLSPFTPDKTHMHHLFIDMGCGHICTTLCVVGVNLIPVVLWVITENIVAMSINVQFYIILSSCILLNVGIYLGVNYWRRVYPQKFEAFRQRNLIKASQTKEDMKPLRKLLDGM